MHYKAKPNPRALNPMPQVGAPKTICRPRASGFRAHGGKRPFADEGRQGLGPTGEKPFADEGRQGLGPRGGKDHLPTKGVRVWGAWEKTVCRRRASGYSAKRDRFQPSVEYHLYGRNDPHFSDSGSGPRKKTHADEGCQGLGPRIKPHADEGQ